MDISTKVEYLIQYSIEHFQDNILSYQNIKLDTSKKCDSVADSQVLYSLHLEVSISNENIKEYSVVELFEWYVRKPLTSYIGDIGQFLRIMYGNSKVDLAVCPLVTDSKFIKYPGKFNTVETKEGMSFGYIFYPEVVSKTDYPKIVIDAILYNAVRG